MPTEHVVITQEFGPLLRRNNLDAFRQVMALPSIGTVRAFPGRNTIRLPLQREDGSIQVVYLKRYERRYLSFLKRLRRFLHWPGADDEAMREWRGILELRAQHFATAVPIAVGQRRSWGVVTESFLMTAEIPSGVQGDFYFRDATSSERRELAVQIAGLGRRFHDAGFVHKDFYLCHIFVAPKSETRELFLIDLQRAHRPRWFFERWRIKDLGALAHSALRFGASRKDLARFFKHYLGVNRFGLDEKRLAGKILKRVRQMSRHQPRHDKHFEQPRGW